ncbi:TonB-dependent receptor [Hirschia litorea]|uniref:TonB-dependent receptor n=1 Tax=Hirschia litorea TaxID=1199156 RepID=A0ABW2IPA4_9PROT
MFAQPTSKFDAKLRLFYQQDDDGPAAAGFIPGRLADTCSGTTRQGLDDQGNSVILNPTGFVCGDVPELGNLNFNPIDYNTSLRLQAFAGGNADFLINNLLNANTISGVPELDRFGLRRDMFRASLKTNYEFENNMTLSMSASYNESQGASLRDLDLTPTESWYSYNARKSEDKGIDISLTSSDGGRLTWLVGANYYEQEFLTSATGGTFVAACPIAAFCPLFLPTGNDGGDFADVSSIYGAASFDITDKLTLGIEGRFQSEDRNDGISTITQSYEEFLPRITASYEVSDALTLYANWSQGFLPGLTNGVIINCSQQAYTSPFIDPNTGLPSSLSECDQMRATLGADFKEFTDTQTLDSIEIGFKIVGLNGRLNLNTAAYSYDWSNQPSTNFVTVYRDDDLNGVPNATPNTVQIASSGSSKSHGVEVDASYVATDNLRFDGSLSYNSNEYTNYLGLTTFARANGGSRNFQGNRAPRFPEWSGNISSTYTHQLNAMWEMFVRGDIVYQGETFTSSANLAKIRPFALADFRMGLEKDDLRLEIFVKNIFDETSWRGGLSYFDVGNPADPGTFDFNNLGVTVIPQEKRTFGIRAELSF